MLLPFTIKKIPAASKIVVLKRSKEGVEIFPDIFFLLILDPDFCKKTQTSSILKNIIFYGIVFIILAAKISRQAFRPALNL